MRACIHRGAHAIGGSLVELEAHGSRLVIDIGLPLTVSEVSMRDLFPDVPGLWGPGDGSLLGVLVSHGHGDHIGLADVADPRVPTYLGAATGRINRLASLFVPGVHDVPAAGHLADGHVLDIGPFRITPVLVDHSAFDAYAFVIEADGKRLVYSGDLRGHGRKPSSLSRLAARGAEADVLLLEGTRIGQPTGASLTEIEVEDGIADFCGQTTGWVLVAASGQNVDRLVTLFKAARRSGRDLIVDAYAALVLDATGRDTIPHASWDGVRVFLPSGQRRRIIELGRFELLEPLKPHRIYPEELAEQPDTHVILFRQSMIGDLERIGVPPGSGVVWSMWRGYLDAKRAKPLHAFCTRHELQLAVIHASGHADIEDLRKLVSSMAPRRVVPIHTDAPAEYPAWFRHAN
ncbi:MAG: MBL fold metallo-hydrolase [Solirubrobacteraceae bacterium]